MPQIRTSLLQGSRGATVRELHRELLVLRNDIATTELSNKLFGASTLDAIVAFQEQAGLEPTGVVNKATGAVMTAAARFATEGNTAQMRQELKTAVDANPDEPALGLELTRYEVLAGNYGEAKTILSNLPISDAILPELQDTLADILAAPTETRDIPEVPYPGNFYTYRYSFFNLQTINNLLNAFASNLTEGGFNSLTSLAAPAPTNDSEGIPIDAISLTGTAALINGTNITDPSGESIANDSGVALVGVDQPSEAVPSLPRHARPDLNTRSPQPSVPDNGNFGLAGYYAMTALRHWFLGNRDMNRQLYARAEAHYNECQRAVMRYFFEMNPNFRRDENDFQNQLNLLLSDLHFDVSDPRTYFWQFFRGRRKTLSLATLYHNDWEVSTQLLSPYTTVEAFLGMLQGTDTDSRLDREVGLEAPLITIAFVLAPLARAEANRQRRHFQAAIDDCDWVLSLENLQIQSRPLEMVDALYSLDVGGSILFGQEKAPFGLLCEFIELPFAKLLKGQVLLDKADAEYKARKPVGTPIPNDASDFQNLQAAYTYQNVLNVFSGDGDYVANVIASSNTLSNQLDGLLNNRLHPLTPDDGTPRISNADLHGLQTIGKGAILPDVTSTSEVLPGLDMRSGPHEPILVFNLPAGAEQTTNPLIYALVMEAHARRLQIRAKFNYLGYKDEYIPPWRFQYLLERARYFAEHAKNAQREYLNFLSNAEREELREITASQTVELEKSNIRIETARIDQARLEVGAAKLSQELARLTARNAKKRFTEYKKLDEFADEITDRATVGGGLINTREGLGSMYGGFGTFLADLGSALAGAFGFGGNDIFREIQEQITAKQREFEKLNLQLTVGEAEKSAQVADAQLEVAKAGLIVAGIQRSAALLRHEFAVQSLNFLRNRTLNTEIWYRLAAMIRSVSDTYMRYAVELAFLAEQAYEFEADRRLDVIRFDYDVSEIGSLLAADFLLRDLDTLEQDLIVTQRIRQQQVQYVVSLAREFPEALQELRDTESTIFTVRLEQLERRFPGVFNLRIGAVDVSPVALMDPTRFSLEMTYLGSSQVRLKAQPDTAMNVPSPSPLNNNDVDGLVDANGNAIIPWLSNLSDTYPVKIRVTGPETNVHSGLTRQDISSVFSFISTSQRNAFEGLGASASWRIDMSMKDNKVVPGTLADILITFTLYGYYDTNLRTAIDNLPPQTQILTQYLSARQRFADAFYEFNQNGRMVWDITESMLSLDAPVRNLRNLGIILLPGPNQLQFGSLMSTYMVELEVTAGNQFEVLTPVPQITLSINQLQVTVSVGGADGATVFLDFGEGDGFQSSNNHTYSRPGKYIIGLRLVKDSRLYEYKAEISVSRSQTLTVPLTAFPSFEDAPQGQTGIQARTNAPANEDVTVIWRVDQNQPERGLDTLLDLKPGKHVVRFTALRNLQGRIYSEQRFVPDQPIDIEGLRLSTNRVFELDGTETTGLAPNDSANDLTERLFPEDPQTNERLPLSPIDRWILELLADDNPFLFSVTPSDNLQADLKGVEDAILILEYETGIS